MSKRGNGEGTVYQRKDGRWAAELTVIGKRLTDVPPSNVTS